MLNQFAKLLFYRLVFLLLLTALMPTTFVILLCVKSYLATETFVWLLSAISLLWLVLVVFVSVRYVLLRREASPLKKLAEIAESKYVLWGFFLLNRFRKSLKKK